MAITTTEQTSILNLVVSMFNAAPGAANLTSIAAAYEANGKNMAALANSLAMSSAFTDQFAGLITNEAIANKMAANFGLTTGTAYTNAYNYFVGQLAAGASKAAIMKAANDYLIGTHDAMFNDAAATLVNKTTVALDYSVTKQLSGATIADLRAAVSGVDATAASVTAKTSAAATGTTYTLTTAADAITGTTGNDTITGTRAATAAAATDSLTSSDTINGGAGTDTFIVSSSADNTDVTGGALISNVETVSIRQTTAGQTSTLNAALTAGATTVNNYLSSGNVTVSAMAAGATIGVVGNGAITQQTTQFAYAATGSANIAISGGTTAGNITNSGVSSASNTVTSTGANNTVGIIDLGTGTNVTSLTINAATALDADLAADFAANSTITISGAATNTSSATGAPIAAVALMDAALSANIVTVDASGLTAGGASVAMGANTTSFVGGQGNDTVYVGALVYNTTGTVAAGAGTQDILVLTDAAALTSITAAKLTGFEILALMDDNDGALDTFNLSLLTGAVGVALNADSAGDGYSITNMTAAQALNVQIMGTQAVTPTFGITGASTVGQLDTLTIAISDNLTAKNTLTVANLTAAGVETLNINAVDNFTATLLTGMGAMTNTNVTGGGNVSLTTGALALNVNTVINASAATGTVTVDATSATTNGVAITGTTSTQVNTLTGSAQADTITGGAGNDILVGLAGNDTINGGAGNDTITGGAGTDTINVGAGNDIIKFATVDAETQVGVVASGFTATGDLITGLGNGDVINLATGGGTAGGTYADGAIAVGTTFSAGVANEVLLVSGSYNATTGVFTAGAASTTNNDYVFQYNGGATATTVNSVILIDIVGTLTATSASEVITLTVA